MSQLDLFTHVAATYADAGAAPISNAALYVSVAERAGVDSAALGLLDPLRQWPNDWAFDLPPGIHLFASGLRDFFRQFLLTQIQSGRSISTIRRHRNELHILGYECIRSLVIGFPRRAPTDVRSYLVSLNPDQGGPLLSCMGATIRDQVRFDTTCRVLARWMRDQR